MAKLLASADDLSKYWRTLGFDEIQRAVFLIGLASDRLRLYAEQAGIDIDQKADESEAYASMLKFVVIDAVKRVMQSPVDQASVESYSQTAGPYSENYKYSNPTGDMFFKKADLKALGLSGSQSLSSIAPKTSRNIYGSNKS